MIEVCKVTNATGKVDSKNLNLLQGRGEKKSQTYCT